LDLISETEVGEQVYNSNAIENSTLTLGDTEKVFKEILKTIHPHLTSDLQY
jgi:hypothetical protein